MTIDISAGRFGPVSLATQDVQNVRQATDRNHIGSIFSRAWDKVADWFCNTNRTEAKKCLFDLYSETTPHHQKIESFHALKGMAGAEYQNRFQIEENETGVRYTLDLSEAQELSENQCPGFSLSFKKLSVDREALGRELNRDDYWGNGEVSSARKQVEKDLCRASYSVSGSPLQKGSPDERMGHFDEALTALGVTPSQRTAIMEVCNQSTIAAFLQSADNITAPGGQHVLYDVRTVEGELRVQAVCIKDIDIPLIAGKMDDPELRQTKMDMILAEGDHPLYKSQYIELDLRIVDGDPRAKIEIVGTQHLASRDNDTIQ